VRCTPRRETILSPKGFHHHKLLQLGRDRCASPSEPECQSCMGGWGHRCSSKGFKGPSIAALWGAGEKGCSSLAWQTLSIGKDSQLLNRRTLIHSLRHLMHQGSPYCKPAWLTQDPLPGKRKHTQNFAVPSPKLVASVPVPFPFSSAQGDPSP
jgi:hypothetical protein